MFSRFNITLFVLVILSLVLLAAKPASATVVWDDCVSGKKGADGKFNSKACWEECSPGGVPTFQCLELLSGSLLRAFNGLIVIILFIMFSYGGYLYLTSFGEEEKIKQAQDTFKWAVIGVIVYVSAFLILTIIDNALLGGKGDIFRFRFGTQQKINN